MFRLERVGGLICALGLLLLVFSGAGGVTAEAYTGDVQGGACVFCDNITGQCGGAGGCFPINQGANAGKWTKQDAGTGLTEASCASTNNVSARTCEVTNYAKCFTQYVCTDRNCTNCATGTDVNRPSACNISGTCAGG